MTGGRKIQVPICVTEFSENNYKEEDIADSLLYAITDNLAAQAYLVAKAEKINYTCFCGNYVEDNDTIRSIITDKLQAAALYLGVSLFISFERILKNKKNIFYIGSHNYVATMKLLCKFLCFIILSLMLMVPCVFTAQSHSIVSAPWRVSGVIGY